MKEVKDDKNRKMLIEEEPEITNVEEGDTTKNYGIDLEFKGREAHLSVETTYHTNPDFLEVTNIEFLEDSDKFTEEEKKEIEEYISDNYEKWSEEGWE